MLVDNSLVISQRQFHDDQRYNFRCCICRKLSGRREKEICGLVLEEEMLSIWELFDNDPNGIGEHFVVAGDFLFFRYLNDAYFCLTCEGPQFGASLRKIVDQFSIKDIYVQKRLPRSNKMKTSHITVDAFREILQRRDLTLNELRSLISFHESRRLKPFCLLVGSLFGHVGTYMGTILTISALASAYILRGTKPGWLLAVTTVALHVLRYLEDAWPDPSYDALSWIRASKEVIQAHTPSLVKAAFRLLAPFVAAAGNIILPAVMAVASYHSGRHLVGRLSPIASICLKYALDKADTYPRSTILTLLVVSALFAEIALEKLREEERRYASQKSPSSLALLE